LDYSRNRLLALRDEWKPTFPDIDRLFNIFRLTSAEMSAEQLTKTLDEGAMLLADPSFRGVRWLTELTAPIWRSGDDDWFEVYQHLIQLFYEIGFIGIRGASSRIHYAHGDPGFADSQINLAGAIHFAIHPAFRPALDITSGGRDTT
jgi:hypothetical protein